MKSQNSGYIFFRNYNNASYISDKRFYTLMIKVSMLQKGNALLSELKNTSWHYDASVTADYEINFTTAVLFLSLRFYVSKPEYIFKRLNKLKDYRLKILLIHIDVPNWNNSLKELFRMIPITIVLAKDYAECANYIHGFESATTISSDVLRHRESSLDTFLSGFPKITKTEIVRLKNSFKNLQELISTDSKEIGRIFGIGGQKAESLVKYFNKPFQS